LDRSSRLIPVWAHEGLNKSIQRLLDIRPSLCGDVIVHVHAILLLPFCDSVGGNGTSREIRFVPKQEHRRREIQVNLACIKKEIHIDVDIGKGTFLGEVKNEDQSIGATEKGWSDTPETLFSGSVP
jgi:hypothetical protein